MELTSMIIKKNIITGKVKLIDLILNKDFEDTGKDLEGYKKIAIY